MNSPMRAIPRLVRRWSGIALLLGSALAAAAPLSAPAPAVAAAGNPLATRQVMLHAEARTAYLATQAGKPAICKKKHRHGLRYRVQQLEVGSNDFEGHATAVNNHGWVVGYSVSGAGDGIRPTLWIGGQAYDLGSPYQNNYVYDINDAGKIVGLSYDLSGLLFNAVSWYRGEFTVLPKLGGDNGVEAAAFGINRKGTIVGNSGKPGLSGVRAAAWNGGAPRELENLGGAIAYAMHINDLGYSAGYANVSGGILHAVVWTPQGAIIDLSAGDAAYDLNNRGRVVGTVSSSGATTYPLHWVRGVRSTLPTLGGSEGVAYGVNDRDEAVGYSTTATGLERATIWYGARAAQLDTLLEDGVNININIAYGINEKGQIAAISRNPVNNRVQPLLLTPYRCHGK